MEVARAAHVGMVDDWRAPGLRRGAVEIVGQDGSDARGGERADRDGPGGGRFRPGGVEPAVEPPYTQAGAKTLLGMGAAGEHRQDEPLRVGPDRTSPALEALWGPLGIAPVGARHVIRIGAVPASAEAALMGGDALAAMEHLDRAAGEAHVNLRADQRVRHRVEEALGLDMIIEVDPSQAPLGIFVVLGRQRPERRPLDALEELAPADPKAAHHMGVDGRWCKIPCFGLWLSEG